MKVDLKTVMAALHRPRVRKNNVFLTLGGKQFKASKTLMLICKQGLVCQSCSAKGEYFLVNGHHINLIMSNGCIATKDHILPKSKGGPSYWKNLQLLCSSCNADKADDTPSNTEIYMNAVATKDILLQYMFLSHCKKDREKYKSYHHKYMKDRYMNGAGNAHLNKADEAEYVSELLEHMGWGYLPTKISYVMLDI